MSPTEARSRIQSRVWLNIGVESPENLHNHPVRSLIDSEQRTPWPAQWHAQRRDNQFSCFWMGRSLEMCYYKKKQTQSSILIWVSVGNKGSHQMYHKVHGRIRPLTTEVLWFEYEVSPTDDYLFPSWGAVVAGCGTFKKWF